MESFVVRFVVGAGRLSFALFERVRQRVREPPCKREE
jgi:hypothetical protein